MHSHAERGNEKTLESFSFPISGFLVPTLCVGMHASTLRVEKWENAGLLCLTLLLILLNRPLLAEEFDFESPLPPATQSDLPALPRDNLPLSSIARLKVKQFKFEGNRVLSDNELRTITQAYENTIISAEKLQEIKNQITRYYISKGYVNSGAIIPDQKVNDGVVTIKIIEGQLTRIDVFGNERLRSAYIQKRLENVKGSIIQLKELQERMQMLHQNPLLERIQAELLPGSQMGEGILKVHVHEARPYQLQFNFDNHRSPSVGAYRGEIEGWYRNFTGLFRKGWGDTLYLRYGLTEGMNDYSLRYSFPVDYDSLLSFEIRRSDSEVVELPFKQLDIESETNTYAISFTHSLQRFKKFTQSLKLGVRLEKRASKSFLLSQPFSFSSGALNGESKISVIRLSQDWLKRSRLNVFAARSTFNFGLDAFDSTIHDDGLPDSQFFSWVGQLQYVRRLETRFQSQIIFRTHFQWANQRLLALEQLSIGGVSSVRGYRENFIIRDNAFISSLEWRIPIKQLAISKFKQNPADGLLKIAFFADYGRAWNADSETFESEYIYSVGLGVHWSPNKQIRTQIYWGYALRDIPEPKDRDLQDSGVHFEMKVLF